jgi:fluoride exporter
MWFYIGMGGIIGSLLRYFVSMLTNQFSFSSFPLSTFIVNLIGSFLLGFLSGFFMKKPFQKVRMYAAITTGLIGSFTTFSTFSNETIQLMKNGDFLILFLYLFGSILLGLTFAFYGIHIGRKWNERTSVEGEGRI